MLRSRIANLKLLLVAIVCGLFAALGTGSILNESGISLPEIKRYGYPLVWLVTNLNGPNEYLMLNFALDAVFWIVVSLLMLILLKKLMFPATEASVNRRSLVILMVLLIPVGFLIALVHESGHAVWGILAGGTLDYMKIAYLEIYPQLAINHPFQLGLTRVSGLNYGSAAYGLMLLGGSTTTHFTSWILGIALLHKALGSQLRFALKALGLFGVVDLPFYIIFPQVGLRHWVFLGGSEPEPLNGATMIGIPDSAFYLVAALSVFGLALLYSKTLRSKISATVKGLLLC